MIIEKNNLQYLGANDRPSLYDVIYPKSDAKLPLVLFCHGFKGFKDWGHWRSIFRDLASEGFVVVKFNLSHNGIGLTDVFDFTDLNAFAENNYLKELEDLDRIMDHLKKDELINEIADPSKLHLIGHSRGGSVCILKASKDKRIKSLTTWAAVADLEERLPMGEELESWRKEGVRFIANARTAQQMPMAYQFVESFQKHAKELNVERACKKISIPMLIVHGENDPTVGLEHAYALQIWNPSAQLECIPNADHVFNGRHPFEEEVLPLESKRLLELTVNFLKEKGN